MRKTLKELDHKQLENLIQVDNATATGFIHKQIKQRLSKAIDMIFIGFKIDNRNNNSMCIGKKE